LGFRFQKRISILPGVRINLSKSGASASAGPRGADVNIGKDGVTANAGIPGTGLSYRQKVGGSGKAGWLAVLLVIGGLAVWAFQHWSKIEKTIASSHPAPSLSTASPTDSSPDPSTELPTGQSTQLSTASVAADSTALGAGNMTRFVHRQGAILREEPRPSSHILKKEMKGAVVTLVSQNADGWAQVKDGDMTGWMRASLLGPRPSP
jgi:hypothetical protein